LAAVLLATAALVAWRLWPARQPAPADGAGHTLADLPHVASVEGAPAPRAERTVVHLRDWHLVPRGPFDKDVKPAADRDLSKDELDRLYAEHLDAVEKVQKQLDAILRRLGARHRGLPVYVEGLTDDGVTVFKLKATALSDVGAEQIPEARRSLAEVRGMNGPKAAELAKQYEELIARHRAESLELGAVLGPCAEELVEVRALDDAEALKAAQLRWLGGLARPKSATLTTPRPAAGSAA
jgi:hypothetical protein